MGSSKKAGPFFALCCNLSPLCRFWWSPTAYYLSKRTCFHTLHLSSCLNPSLCLMSTSQRQSLLPIKASFIQLKSLSGMGLLEVTDGGSCPHLAFVNPSAIRYLAVFKVTTEGKELSHHGEHLLPSIVICCSKLYFCGPVISI